jgi:tetratricopeptide (TPR) repeat protein
MLEGSVRKSGNRLRITVQLINAADGYHLWSERYEREMQNIFNVQDEITLAVVDALKVKLFDKEKAAVLKRYTDSVEAYHLYLKGGYFKDKWTEVGLKKGIECFNQAIHIDPNYAQAYAALANCYSVLGLMHLHSQEVYPKAKEAALKALELDNTLAEAHTSLGVVKFFTIGTGQRSSEKRSLPLS